jgi:hypothetical protein
MLSKTGVHNTVIYKLFQHNGGIDGRQTGNSGIAGQGKDNQ